jgi:hypothetical protein
MEAMRNWSGTTLCSPLSVFHPRSLAEVAQFVRDHAEEGIKVCNARPHSPNDIWCTKGLEPFPRFPPRSLLTAYRRQAT